MTDKHTVLRRFLASTIKEEWVEGAERKLWSDQVWEGYRASYSAIGLSVANEAALNKYDEWQLYVDEAKRVRAFHLYKKGPYGLKTGVLGSDGSAEGKTLVKANIQKQYHQSGVYGEVSHGVEKLALSAGSPVVCAIYAPDILKKPITYESDGVHYIRSLEGVGRVTKVLVGKPRGIPEMKGSCPVPDESTSEEVRSASDSPDDTAEHFSCLLEL